MYKLIFYKQQLLKMLRIGDNGQFPFVFWADNGSIASELSLKFSKAVIQKVADYWLIGQLA